MLRLKTVHLGSSLWPSLKEAFLFSFITLPDVDTKKINNNHIVSALQTMFYTLNEQTNRA